MAVESILIPVPLIGNLRGPGGGSTGTIASHLLGDGGGSRRVEPCVN